MSQVLIIEDNVDLSTLFQMALEISGIQADICRDERDALSKIRAQKPSVVLLDMHLPNISGETIYTHIKLHYKEIVVLVITADRQLYSKYKSQAKAFLKPMSMPELQSEVRAIL